MAFFPKKSMGGGDDEKPDVEIEIGDAEETTKSAAKDVLAAIKSGDVSALDAALKAHHEAYMHASGDDEE